MSIQICIQCKKEYSPSKYSHNQKYCSKKCCWKHWDIQRPASRTKYQKEYKKKWISIPGNRQAIRSYQREWQKEQRDTLRHNILKKYGNKCRRCGFSDWRALQIDHINGGGRKDFIQNYQVGRSRGRRYYYKEVLADTTNKYQILCANCNWIKKWERNEI